MCRAQARWFVLSCFRSYQPYSRCLMHVFLLPAPSQNVLGQRQAYGPLWLIWPLSFLKAMSGLRLEFCPWGPLCQIAVGQATCRLGRRKKEGNFASACLQNVSGNGWESLNVGALQNILLQRPPANAAQINVWAPVGQMWVHILLPLPADCVPLGNSFAFLNFGFFTCKMEVMTVSG